MSKISCQVLKTIVKEDRLDSGVYQIRKKSGTTFSLKKDKSAEVINVKNLQVYFLSNRKPKRGDSFWSIGFSEPFKCLKIDNDRIYFKGKFKSLSSFPIKNNLLIKRIEATTNSKIKLATIPKKFLIRYVQKKCSIETVNIDCERNDNEIDSCSALLDNEGSVVISKLRNEFSRAELQDLLHKALTYTGGLPKETSVFQISEWLEKLVD